MTQSGGAENTFSSVTLYNFQKSRGAKAPPAPPPPRALFWFFGHNVPYLVKFIIQCVQHVVSKQMVVVEDIVDNYIITFQYKSR